jgi:hypothetical protein
VDFSQAYGIEHLHAVEHFESLSDSWLPALARRWASASR